MKSGAGRSASPLSEWDGGSGSASPKLRRDLAEALAKADPTRGLLVEGRSRTVDFLLLDCSRDGNEQILKEEMKQRIGKIIRLLKNAYPDATIALHYKNPLELLVSTILSAQCTDKRVNKVTPALFKRYKTAGDYASAELKAFEQEIRSTGFYRNKAKNIIAAAQKIKKEFEGKVPDSMDKLIQLPGVARKTANVVLFHGFGKTEGIAVDTHVRRVSRRLALTKNDDPVKIEQDLMRQLPGKKWGMFSVLLIAHGRNACIARKPLCLQCCVGCLCPSKKKFYPD